ncbi:hypothetical protein [Listeria fleischmannii]|uniref:Uncharacterized protein n=1 Tax=Listeria fleischmannii FSL S10-1203 TaxID=1265822 RepID=W7D2S3_9LIST|nr:hypothetical protein [Listeria fleischmannii]EUJ43492.1 hypothetical protein MCOL2_20518 [Listeria fleischmannii FSL S10-1203]
MDMHGHEVEIRITVSGTEVDWSCNGEQGKVVYYLSEVLGKVLKKYELSEDNQFEMLINVSEIIRYALKGEEDE